MSSPDYIIPEAERPALPTEVELADQAAAAHQLNITGMPWRDVAEQTGYPSANAAYLAVRRMLEQAATERGAAARAAELELEMDRLDAIQRAFWPAAMLGDEKAAMVVLKVIGQRGKWKGFEQADTRPNGPNVLVITGATSEEYIARLQEAQRVPVAITRGNDDQ